MPLDVAQYLGSVSVADGAWGTELDKLGVPPGYCREEWNLSHPEEVRSVAAAYVDAGAQIVLTNTFGGNFFVLDRHGFAGQAKEINVAGARLSSEAAGDRAKVFGSLGPSGKIVMIGEVETEKLYDAFKDQALALAEGGADALVCETMTELDEIVAAVKAIKENTDLPVVAGMTYDSGRTQTDTMMGVTPKAAAKALVDAGADIIGCNCGIGVENYVKVVKLLRAATDLPIWVKANAGLPELEGDRVVYRMTPDEYAGHVSALIEAGANIIGGCCGTNPDFIRAIRAAVDAR